MPNQQRKKTAKQPLRLERVFLAFIILAGIATLGILTLLPVRQCRIVGETRYTAQEYAEAMDLRKQYISIVTMDKAGLAERVKKALPYANIIRVSKVFPNVVRLHVKDGEPAFAQKADRQWWLISEEGKLLELTAKEPKSIYLITGMVLRKPAAGQPARWRGSRATVESFKALLQELQKSELGPHITGLRVTSDPVPDAVYQNRLRLRFGAPPPNTGMPQEEILREKLRLAWQTIVSLDEQNPLQRGVLDLSIMGQAYFSAEWAE